MKKKTGKFIPCGLCGKETWSSPSRFNKWIRRFCSRQHQLQWQKKHAFSFGCIICHKQIFTQPAQLLYRAKTTCSPACRRKLVDLKVERNLQLKPPTEGALRRRIRYSTKMEEWRKAVFERDDYTCRFCGARSGKGQPVILNADHIKPFAHHPELRFNLDNGRTLCLECHRKTPTWGRPKERNPLHLPA